MADNLTPSYDGNNRYISMPKDPTTQESTWDKGAKALVNDGLTPVLDGGETTHSNETYNVPAINTIFRHLNDRVQKFEVLGQYLGSFDGFVSGGPDFSGGAPVTVPFSKAAFDGKSDDVSVGDFITVRYDDSDVYNNPSWVTGPTNTSLLGKQNRYVVSEVLGDKIVWEFDITYYTKQELQKLPIVSKEIKFPQGRINSIVGNKGLVYFLNEELDEDTMIGTILYQAESLLSKNVWRVGRIDRFIQDLTTATPDGYPDISSWAPAWDSEKDYEIGSAVTHLNRIHVLGVSTAVGTTPALSGPWVPIMGSDRVTPIRVAVVTSIAAESDDNILKVLGRFRAAHYGEVISEDEVSARTIIDNKNFSGNTSSFRMQYEIRSGSKDLPILLNGSLLRITNISLNGQPLTPGIIARIASDTAFVVTEGGASTQVKLTDLIYDYPVGNSTVTVTCRLHTIPGDTWRVSELPVE
jgi:hypothetical protein